MNKENPKKNKKSFEYYIAQRKEEFRCYLLKYFVQLRIAKVKPLPWYQSTQHLSW